MTSNTCNDCHDYLPGCSQCGNPMAYLNHTTNVFHVEPTTAACGYFNQKDRTKMKLTSENVTSVFMDSMFRDEEVADAKPQEGEYLKGVGALRSIGFHPQRTESHRQDVVDMLECLNDTFKASVGGGWTFLHMCVDRDGEVWTDRHLVVDQLICLGVALNLVELTPREMNSILPGGVPYVIYNDKPIVRRSARSTEICPTCGILDQDCAC